MCGLVGYISPANSKVSNLNKIISDMLFIDSLRGMDSTGIVASRRGETYWYKTLEHGGHLTPSSLKEIFTISDKEKGKIFALDGGSVFGHNRKATLGGVSIDTAHPVLVNPNNKWKDLRRIWLMHNGTVRNLNGLSVWRDNPNWDSGCIAKTLAEASDEEAVEVLEKIRGAFALVWGDFDDPNKVHLARNKERPLYFATFKEELFMYASDDDYLKLVCSRWGLEYEKIYSYSTGVLSTIDFSGEKLKVSERKFKDTHSHIYPGYGNVDYYWENYGKASKINKLATTTTKNRMGSWSKQCRDTLRDSLNKHVVGEWLLMSVYKRQSPMNGWSFELRKPYNPCKGIDFEVMFKPFLPSRVSGHADERLLENLDTINKSLSHTFSVLVKPKLFWTIYKDEVEFSISDIKIGVFDRLKAEENSKKVLATVPFPLVNNGDNGNEIYVVSKDCIMCNKESGSPIRCDVLTVKHENSSSWTEVVGTAPLCIDCMRTLVESFPDVRSTEHICVSCGVTDISSQSEKYDITLSSEKGGKRIKKFLKRIDHEAILYLCNDCGDDFIGANEQ